MSSTLSLEDLLPEKAPVETSLGTLYVRHAYTSDWKHFGSDDTVELGRAVVQQLVNRAKDKNDASPLINEDLDALVDNDFNALAPVIAKQSGWEYVSGDHALQSLGQALTVAKEQERVRQKKMLDDMRRSIDRSYSFLGKSTLDKLQDQVAGISAIQKSLSGVDALRKAMDSAGLSNNALKDSLASARVLKDMMHGIELPNIPAPIEPRLIEVSHIPMPPRPEETPVGRAAIESAKNSREVAEKMEALAAVVGGLNQTLVTEVLPSWFRQVEEDQQNAKDSLDQAASGLWWTKWAVIMSVLVTVLVAWWQVWVAKDIDRENSIQQQKQEVLLREQLSMQQKLIEQQARDAVQLRSVIEQQMRNFEKLQKGAGAMPQNIVSKK